VLYTLDCLHLFELRPFWRDVLVATRDARSQVLVVTNRNPVILACGDDEELHAEGPYSATMRNTHFELYRGHDRVGPGDPRRYYRYSGIMVCNLYDAIHADITVSP
jgi:hypothetical protein